VKIVLCTTPIRPLPTDSPPIGALAIFRALSEAGHEPAFYDIDALRPSFEEVRRFFEKEQPDLVGISAVVSTAYAYTKRLSLMLKQACPNAVVVVGGNLAASAEILHRFASVDYCVVGEGEDVITALVRHLQDGGGKKDARGLASILGLTHLDSNGQLSFHGFPDPLPPERLIEPDYSILEKYSRIENFITYPLSRPDFAQDPRSREPRRKDKKLAVLLTAKGCVNRCTFCHRWDKGYRTYPAESILRHIRRLKERYNVGSFIFQDENFGSVPRQLAELLPRIAAEDILYSVTGVRARTVDPEMLRRLKDSGCVALYYGMETGSQRILEVMEKRCSLEDNARAVRWTAEAGLYTIYQIVLGMPGEDEGTISETMDFINRATEILPEPPLNRVSVNYIQALPGTPVYEFARLKGLIGRSLREEEDYLLRISDVDAADETKFINFTDCATLTVQGWRRRILLEATRNHRRARGSSRDRRPHAAAMKAFNLQRARAYDWIASYAYPFRRPILWLWLLKQNASRMPVLRLLGLILEQCASWLRRPAPPREYISLRKLVHENRPAPATPSEAAMEELRAGR